MKTWEDLQQTDNEMEFVRGAIKDYQSDPMYLDACAGFNYFSKRNTTILNYIKLLYKMSGEAVPDNFSANYKFCNGFLPIFVQQENSYLLGNGVIFNKNDTKNKLGGDEFDLAVMDAGENALWGGIAYGFWNLDHVDVFDALEFVPLWGEEDGALHAGIRFWQIAPNKPLRATLYKEDGYIEYIWKDGQGSVYNQQRSYKQIVRTSVVDGTEIIDGENYPAFPIVPLWGNKLHQSELVGLREKIDGYDLIQSGFANDLDDASQIYWTLQNAGGMDDIDLATFVQHMKTVKAAVMDGDGATAEAHTLEVPHEAREAALQNIKDSLYRDAMALDVDKLSASGNVTATAINAAYQNLDLKCDRYETCVTTFIKGILVLAGINDIPTYKRTKLTNTLETTQMVLAAAEYLDDETILSLLPFITVDQIDTILEKRTEEEATRFGEESDEGSGEENLDEGDIGDAVDAAEDVKGQALNGAQTQSLIMIMEKFSDGKLSENQAINMIATAIGVSKDKAREIVQGL